MISADGLFYRNSKTIDMMYFSEHETPVGIQLYGQDPRKMADACRLAIDRGFDAVDLNCGCSVKKVIKVGAGAALMQTPERLAQIISVMRKTIPHKPLTIKIRSGHDSENLNYIEIAHIAQEEGCDAVTLHPRTQIMKMAGMPDWNHIAELKAQLKIPVVGNGGLMSPEDVGKMRALTRCDYFMFSRGAIGNPWIFSQTDCFLKTGAYDRPSAGHKLKTAADHLKLALADPRGPLAGFNEFKPHVTNYTKGIHAATDFRREFLSLKNPQYALARWQAFTEKVSDFEKERGYSCV